MKKTIKYVQIIGNILLFIYSITILNKILFPPFVLVSKHILQLILIGRFLEIIIFTLCFNILCYQFKTQNHDY